MRDLRALLQRIEPVGDPLDLVGPADLRRHDPREARTNDRLQVARTIVAASAVAAMSAGFARLVLGAESSDASSAVIAEWVLVAAFLISGRAVIAMRSRVDCRIFFQSTSNSSARS